MGYIALKYIGILAVITVLGLMLSRMLNVSTENTWLSVAYMNAMGLIVVKMLWDMVHSLKKKHFPISIILIFFSVMVVIGTIMGNITFFTEL